MTRTRDRSGFFRALARYQEAGIALDRGLRDWAGQLPGRQREPFHAMAQQLRSGQTLDTAGLASGVLLPWEARLLATGSAHGRLDQVLDELAGYHDRATAWWTRLRLRLLFPGAVLILGWLALPLPQLLAGQLSITAYALQCLLFTTLLALAWQGLGSTRFPLRFLELVLPFKAIAGPIWQYQRHRFLQRLASLHGAGVMLLDALQIAVDGCDSPYLRRQWSPVVAEVKHGSSVSQALYRHGALDATGHALLQSGEAAGNLGAMLIHEARRLEQSVGLWLDSLSDWLPRLAYVLVLLLLFGKGAGSAF